MAPQLIGMKGPSRRPLKWCIARAKPSFPVPLSPVSRTWMPVGATWSTDSMAAMKRSFRPTSWNRR